MNNTKDPTLGEVNTNLSSDELAAMRKLITQSQGSENPNEPTAPQPPKPGQNADVTGSRPLHTETTPARQLDIQPTSKTSVFQPRTLTHSSPSTGESSKSDDMLQTVAAYTMTSIPHHSTATYTPSCHGMYYTLSEMDRTMSITRRWLDNSFGWIPHYSRLYYGVMFIIQILRSQRDSGNLDFSTLIMLDAFERYFNPGNQLIAGPLVPHFKALATSKIDSDLYGNVAPVLPSVPGIDNFSPIPRPTDTNIFHHLPAIPAIFDEICTLITLSVGNNDINKQILTHGNTPGAFGTAFTNTSPATDCENMPGMYPKINVSGPAADSFFACAASYSFPTAHARQTLNAGITNWFQYCRFATGLTDHYDWFARLSGTMSNYAQHFEGSIPLGDISTASLPTGQIIGKYKPKALPRDTIKVSSLSHGSIGNQSTGYFYPKPNANNLLANWTNLSMSIPVQEEWRAMYSQIHCLHDNLTDNVPQNYHNGTFWTLPVVRRCDNVDPKNSISLIISRKFHKVTRNDNA